MIKMISQIMRQIGKETGNMKVNQNSKLHKRTRLRHPRAKVHKIF